MATRSTRQGQPVDETEQALTGETNPHPIAPDNVVAQAATPPPLVEDDDDESIDSYLALDEGDNQNSYLAIDDSDVFGRERITRTLYGADAVRYLGLPVRPHCHMQRGDHDVIGRRFKDIIERIISQNKSADAFFWDNITIRVWNKKNIAKLTKNAIIGKRTADCDAVGVKGGEYRGDLYRGSAAITFLANYKHSTKWREYLVQVESVEVTEEMSRVA